MAQPVTDAETDPIARQRPSRMPYHRYQPYQEQFRVELPDRTWPTRAVEAAPAGAPWISATATRP